MSLTINTNTAAIQASFNLTKNNKNLQDSLTRLSSGKRITRPADDAGGLAVSMKLTSSISRTKAAISNIQNSLSFGEVQDGALQAGARIVDRLAELKTLSLDVMKSSADVANYNTEFRALQQQLYAITTETFSGVSLFASTTTAGGAMTYGTHKHTVSVFTSDRGAAGSIVSLNKLTYFFVPFNNFNLALKSPSGEKLKLIHFLKLKIMSSIIEEQIYCKKVIN